MKTLTIKRNTKLDRKLMAKQHSRLLLKVAAEKWTQSQQAKVYLPSLSEYLFKR